VAYLNKQDEFSVHLMKHHRTKHNRYFNSDQKKTKQDDYIKDASVWKGASSKCLTSEYITNNVVISDGGEYVRRDYFRSQIFLNSYIDSK
jgi:hypothetical protein